VETEKGTAIPRQDCCTAFKYARSWSQVNLID
jgi:hypothetical protein